MAGRNDRYRFFGWIHVRTCVTTPESQAIAVRGRLSPNDRVSKERDRLPGRSRCPLESLGSSIVPPRHDSPNLLR